MAYYLIFNTRDELLVEADHPSEIVTKMWDGSAVMKIGGCEARQYVREGRPHVTKLPSPPKD